MVPEKLRGIFVLKKPSVRWGATVLDNNEVWATHRNKLKFEKLFKLLWSDWKSTGTKELEDGNYIHTWKRSVGNDNT